MKYDEAKGRFRRPKEPSKAVPAETPIPASKCRDVKLTITGPEGRVEINLSSSFRDLGELTPENLAKHLRKHGFDATRPTANFGVDISMPVSAGYEPSTPALGPSRARYVGPGMPFVSFGDGSFTDCLKAELNYLPSSDEVTVRVVVGEGTVAAVGSVMGWFGADWLIYELTDDLAPALRHIYAKRPTGIRWDRSAYPRPPAETDPRMIRTKIADPEDERTIREKIRTGMRSSREPMTTADLEAAFMEKMKPLVDKYIRKLVTGESKTSLAADVERAMREMKDEGKLPVAAPIPKLGVDMGEDGTAHITFTWPEGSLTEEEGRALGALGATFGDGVSPAPFPAPTYGIPPWVGHKDESVSKCPRKHTAEIEWTVERRVDPDTGRSTDETRTIPCSGHEVISGRVTEFTRCICHKWGDFPPSDSHPLAILMTDKTHSPGHLHFDHDRNCWSHRLGSYARICYHEAMLTYDLPRFDGRGGTSSIQVPLRHLRVSGSKIIDLDPCPACNAAKDLPNIHDLPLPRSTRIPATVKCYKSTEDTKIVEWIKGYLEFKDDSGYPTFRAVALA